MSRRAAAVLVALLLVFARGVEADDSDPAPREPGALAEPASDAETPAGEREPEAAKTPPEAPAYRPDPTIRALSSFRIERSVDRETVHFGDPDDPIEPLAISTLGEHLRLLPGIRMRQLSQGPTVETFEIHGGGTGRSELVFGGLPMTLPGTSGPFSHELMLSEISSYELLRAGAAALYGPNAVSGVVFVDPRSPFPEELTSRVVAEEGVDGYQRAGFQLSRSFTNDGGIFVTTESRRIDGFFPGTKEVDRHWAVGLRGRVPGRLEGTLRVRHYEGDGRSGGFETGPVLSVLTKRTDTHAELYRSFGADRGALLEFDHVSERLENVGSADSITREIRAPSLRLTADLPAFAGWHTVARAEGARWRIEREETGAVEQFWRGALAVRTTRPVGGSGVATATLRYDGEESRQAAIQARLEGRASRGAGSVTLVASHNEHIPERGAVGARNETHDSAEIAFHWTFPIARFRAAAFATAIADLRPDPTFEQVRAREAVLEGPQGDATITGATVGLDTDRFRIPGAGGIGEFLLRSSLSWMSAEMDETGERLPGRARRTWTGEGLFERRFFEDELLARVRGRLTHYGDRPRAGICADVDVWATDVILEGGIGDAVFFYRFHDLLERADDIEPCYRFPGFSRMYGISWRFRG